MPKAFILTASSDDFKSSYVTTSRLGLSIAQITRSSSFRASSKEAFLKNVSVFLIFSCFYLLLVCIFLLLLIVFAFDGDSTITKGFDMFLLITLFCSYVQYLRKKVFFNIIRIKEKK